MDYSLSAKLIIFALALRFKMIQGVKIKSEFTLTNLYNYETDTVHFRMKMYWQFMMKLATIYCKSLWVQTMSN